jgi:hypothetical protein
MAQLRPQEMPQFDPWLLLEHQNMKDIDGVYSVAASGPGGSAAGVIQIRGGNLTGKDSLGGEYTGIATRNHGGSVSLRFDVMMPPGSFAVWNGPRAETFTSRTIDIRVPGRSFDEGEPHLIPKLGTWLIFSRIHEQFWRFAGPDGRMCQVNLLLEAERAWQSAETTGTFVSPGHDQYARKAAE